MKKHNSKILILSFALLGVFSSLFMSSCDGVIFSDIRKEVELADAKISGDIQSIIRYTYNGKEHIFVSNGEIYHRSVETSVVDSKIDWQTFSNPTGFIYALAADSSYLYAASVVIDEDDDGKNVGKTRGLYCYKDGSWEKIWSASYSSTDARLFCTNTPQSANREAYFRYGTSVWKLDGTKALTTDSTDTDNNTPMTTGDNDNTTTPTTGVNSCTKLGSTTYFSTAEAMTSNETKKESNTNPESTMIYRSSGSSVYYSTDGKNWTSVDLDCGTIQSIAVTTNYIIVGTSEGIAHQTWATPASPTGGIPNSGNTSFSTNATSTLSSYYTIPALLVVNPSEGEYSATIFASSITSSTSASLKNVGLWSYFPTTGEWNRE